MKFEPWTLLFQAINFIVLAWLLKRLLYRPVLDVLEKRRSEAELIAREASGIEERRKLAAQEAEQARSALAEELARLRAERVSEAEGEAKRLLEQARAQAEELRHAHERTLEEEQEAAYRAVRDRALALGLEAAASLFRDLRSEELTLAFWRRAAARLDGLSQDERQKFSGPDGAPLVVRTYPPLSSEERARMIGELTAVFANRNVNIVEDEALIAGVELEGQQGMLRASVRALLDDLRAQWGEHG